MKKIPLSKTKLFAIVDDRDFNKVKSFKWSVSSYNKAKYCIYAGTRVNGRRVEMHKLILPGHYRIDHKDSDGLNNRRSNLRPCTCSQNGANRRKLKIGSSKYKGVCFSRRRNEWESYIVCEGERIYLGWFKEEQEAAIAYNLAAKKLFGKFARLNKIP